MAECHICVSSDVVKKKKKKKKGAVSSSRVPDNRFCLYRPTDVQYHLPWQEYRTIIMRHCMNFQQKTDF